MVDLENVFYDIGAFICAVFVLDVGADRFIDHTVAVATRLQLSQTLIALLTAGAEWEELAVVVAAVAQRRPALALGNVLGSCISNVLGAFSLGLLFRPIPAFDRSARAYALLQLAVTVPVAASLAAAGPARMGHAGGGVLVAVFVLYILSVAWSIYRGIVKAPEGEDSSDDDGGDEARHLIASDSDSDASAQVARRRRQRPPRPLRYHVGQIVLGFLALSLSGFVLSHAAGSLASSLGLSETVVGLTILSFATTLPEKFVALVSGARGHSGILVAVTAGSNIFLLTLCTGVALLGTGNARLPQESLEIGEIVFVCASSFVFTAVVWLGTRRWVGALMFAGYITFIVLEFTIWRR